MTKKTKTRGKKGMTVQKLDLGKKEELMRALARNQDMNGDAFSEDFLESVQGYYSSDEQISAALLSRNELSAALADKILQSAIENKWLRLALGQEEDLVQILDSTIAVIQSNDETIWNFAFSEKNKNLALLKVAPYVFLPRRMPASFNPAIQKFDYPKDNLFCDVELDEKVPSDLEVFSMAEIKEPVEVELVKVRRAFYRAELTQESAKNKEAQKSFAYVSHGVKEKIKTAVKSTIFAGFAFMVLSSAVAKSAQAAQAHDSGAHQQQQKMDQPLTPEETAKKTYFETLKHEHDHGFNPKVTPDHNVAVDHSSGFMDETEEAIYKITKRLHFDLLHEKSIDPVKFADAYHNLTHPDDDSGYKTKGEMKKIFDDVKMKVSMEKDFAKKHGNHALVKKANSILKMLQIAEEYDGSIEKSVSKVAYEKYQFSHGMTEKFDRLQKLTGIDFKSGQFPNLTDVAKKFQSLEKSVQWEVNSLVGDLKFHLEQGNINAQDNQDGNWKEYSEICKKILVALDAMNWDSSRWNLKLADQGK